MGTKSHLPLTTCALLLQASPTVCINSATCCYLPKHICIIQISPAIADKLMRRESMPKIAPIQRANNVVAYNTDLSSFFSCYCIRNLRNPEKFTQNSNLWSSRSSKVIDLGVNGKPICDFILVINSNFSRICYRFRDIQG